MLKVEAGDRESEVILDYIASLGLACDTQDTVSKRGMKMGKVWWHLLPRTWETEAEDIESRSTWAIQQDHLVSKNQPNKQEALEMAHQSRALGTIPGSWFSSQNPHNCSCLHF